MIGRVAETPKQGIRIPDDRYKAALRRARARKTSASAVVNAALVLYNRGELDELLEPLLFPSVDGPQTGHAPSLPSVWASGHSPSAAIAAT